MSGKKINHEEMDQDRGKEEEEPAEVARPTSGAWDPDNWTASDKSMSKKRLTPGTFGQRPDDGSTCQVKLSNVQVHDAYHGYFNPDLKRVTINEEDSVEGRLFERALCQMDKGEVSHVQINGVGEFDVKLVSFTQPQPVYRMTVAEKINKSKWHKERGVDLFKESRFRDALSRFKKAARLLIMAGKDEEGVLSLYLVVCNNMAMCNLKLGDVENTITLCNKVLNHEPDNVKCLLRRATAYFEDRNFEKCEVDLHKVLEVEPNNAKAKQLLPIVKNHILEQTVKVNNMIKKMFPYS